MIDTTCLLNNQLANQIVDIHSLISVEVSKQFKLDVDQSETKKLAFKKALNMIDQLDYLLDACFKLQETYPKVHQELFEILKSLEIDDPITQAITKKFGSNVNLLKGQLSSPALVGGRC